MWCDVVSWIEGRNCGFRGQDEWIGDIGVREGL